MKANAVFCLPWLFPFVSLGSGYRIFRVYTVLCVWWGVGVVVGRFPPGRHLYLAPSWVRYRKGGIQLSCAWRRGGCHLLVVQTTFSLSFTQSFPGEGGNGAGSLSSCD